MKLSELQLKINKLIENNPDAKDYDVISFNSDHLSSDEVIPEPFESYLVIDNDFYCREALHNTIEEAEDDIMSRILRRERVTMKRVIVLFTDDYDEI